MSDSGLRALYYISSVGNLRSILENGILSHSQVETRKISHAQIYDRSIVGIRHQRKSPDGKTLWEYANLYFEPRNPMLYRVFIPPADGQIVVIGVKKDVLDLPGVYIYDGNAASVESNPFSSVEGRKILPRLLKSIDLKFWSEVDGSKRKIMAECLVPDVVDRQFIEEIYVANEDMAEKVRQIVPERMPVIVNPYMFFQPSRIFSITENLSVLEGDMFFSRMHTLTVSVNLVGIMGAGVASRAKYQFPDVYVKYQDLCKKRILKMGDPYFYKREISTDYELADDPSSLKEPNHETCFLLFPTKHHWKDAKADSKGIETGLESIVDHHRGWGIKSLALPALGCGLGKLSWEQIGPLMVKYLKKLDIKVEIYLPTERKITDAWKTRDFLLPENSQ